MIKIVDPEHFAKTLEFAASVGAFKVFMERVEYLATYGDGLNTVELHKDWAPHSFEFLMLRSDGTRWFNGGLIYQGPGQPADGSAPALTVSLCSDPAVHKWGRAHMILKRRFVWAKDDRSGDTGWIPAWIPKSAEFSPSGARGMMHDIFEHKLNDTGTFANELEAFGRIVALRPVVRADVFGVELYDLWGDADYYDFEAPRVRCDSVDFWALKSIRSITKNFGRTLREHDMERAEIATTCTKAFNLMCLGWMDAQRRYAGNCSHIGSFAMDFGERARLPEGDYDGQVLTVVVDTVAWSWSFRVSADLDAYGRPPAWARAVYHSWFTR